VLKGEVLVEGLRLRRVRLVAEDLERRGGHSCSLGA
jgi:hypothetical protein